MEIVPSSGNVFKDIGVTDPEEMLVKSEIAMRVNLAIKEKGFSQTQAAAMLGVPQPKVSMLQNGKLRGFSLEKLCYFLTLLGYDVDVVIGVQRPGKGQMRVAGP